MALRDVVVGAATKETDHDDLAGDVNTTQVNADVEHDMDLSTGDGSHKSINASGTLDVTGLTTTTGGVLVGTQLDMNALALIMDADADTVIQADTDDQIDFSLGGTDYLNLKTAGALFTQPTHSLEVMLFQTSVSDAGGGLISTAGLWVGRYGSVDDDDVIVLYSAATVSGVLIVSVGTSTARASAIFQVSTHATNQCNLLVQGGNITYAASEADVVGNTGVDGQVTVAAINDNIKVENRSGAATNVGWFLLNA